MNQKKEKRTERKTLPLTPPEFAAFTAAANASGLPLTAWLVQAAREKLARERLNDNGVFDEMTNYVSNIIIPNYGKPK